MKIERCIDYLIIPFNFSNMFIGEVDLETEYSKMIKTIDQTELWDSNSYHFDSRLYSHITSTISDLDQDNLNSIGSCFKFKKDKKARSAKKVPTGQLTIQSKKNKSDNFKIGDIQLNLFKTGIGFLAIEILFDQNVEIDQIVEVNYFLKRIRNMNYTLLETYKQYKIDGKRVKFTEGDGDNTFQIENQFVEVGFNDPNLKENKFKPVLKSNGDKQELILYYDHKIAFREIITSLLEEIPDISYFNDAHEEGLKLPERCLPFSCVIFDSKKSDETFYEEVVGKQLFNLRHTYKDSYLPAPAKLALENNIEVSRIFENSFWGISKEGCANIVILSENKGNNQFFKGNYIGNIRNDYMFLYILALHQYFGLLGFAREFAKLPADTVKYTEEDISKLDILSMRMEFFNLKGIFSEVSFITHQQDVYNKIREILGIKELAVELREEGENIRQIVKHYHNELNEKRISIVSWIGSIFAVLAIVQSLWDLVDSYGSGKAFATEFMVNYPNIDFLITIVFLMSITGLSVALALLLKNGITKVLSLIKKDD